MRSIVVVAIATVIVVGMQSITGFSFCATSADKYYNYSMVPDGEGGCEKQYMDMSQQEYERWSLRVYTVVGLVLVVGVGLGCVGWRVGRG